MLTPAGQSPPDTAAPGHALVGVINAPTQVVLARPVARPGDAARLVDALRLIWRQTFAGDTFKMAIALITTDWLYLQPNIPSAEQPAAAGEAVVAGVGVAAANGAGQPENFCITEIGELGTWLCLIDPLSDTVTVHTGDGHPSRIYPLAG